MKLIALSVAVCLLCLTTFNVIEGYGKGYNNRQSWQSSKSSSPPRGSVEVPKQPNNGLKNPQNGFTIGIMLYENVENLDVCGPFEVFSIAGERNNGTFKVLMLGDKKIMDARNGLKIVSDFLYTDPNLPKLDVLLIPGTNVEWTRNFINNESAMRWIKNMAPKVRYVVSVCTGSFVLGRLGLIDGLKATTHHWAWDVFAEYAPRAVQKRNCRYTDNGRILTSAGISAGIDLSLYFVSRMIGVDKATDVQNQMEYLGRWNNVDRTCIS